jgi:hypothetical protein
VGDAQKGSPSRVRTRVKDLFQTNDVGDAVKGSPSRGRTLAKDMVLVVMVLAVTTALAIASTLVHLTPSAVSFDLSLGVNPSSASIAAGNYTSTNVTATLTGGSSREVRFSCSNLPFEAACAFTPASCTPTCNASLVLFTAPRTPPGTYTVGIGVDAISRTVPFTLTLASTPPPPPPPAFDFTVGIDPTGGSVAPGGSASANVRANLTSGTTRGVHFSCANLSSGITCKFSPPSCGPNCSAALSVATTNRTPEGTYRINVTAADGSLSRAAPYTLRVVNVTNANTTTVTFQKGDGGSYSRTDDAFIYNGSPSQNYGYNLTLLVDAGNCISNGTICRSLIAFPNFLGQNRGQVPMNSTIVSATLQLNVTEPSLTGGPQLLYQITEPWTEGNVTWNAFATPGMPGSKGPPIPFNATLRLIRVNITPIVQNWTKGDPNHGVFIWSQSWDGADYSASESTNPPKLNVTFRPPRLALSLAAQPVSDSSRPLGSRVPSSPPHLGPVLTDSSKIRTSNNPAKGAESRSNAGGTRFDVFGGSVFYGTLGRLDFDPLIFVGVPSFDVTSTCKISDGQKA